MFDIDLFINKAMKGGPSAVKVGRPEIEITAELCEKAKSLGAKGLNLKEIAHVLGMHYDTLNEKRKEYSEFSDAIAVGRSSGVALIKNKMFDKAQDGDNHCMTLYLKNYSDLREKTELDIPNGFTVNIGDKDAGNL